jgi:hypothetical protein
MNQQAEEYDIPFYQLVWSMQAAAWQQMGKVASVVTGKLERDLDQAKNSIDMLEMIQRKTKGNLNEQEKNTLDQVLYELRMNYVDELKKPAEESKTAEERESAKETEPPKEAQASDDKPAGTPEGEDES